MAKSTEQVKKWRLANPEHNRKLRKQELSKALPKRRALLDRLKAGPCTDCHQLFPPECMDFDHVRGVKKFGINIRNVSRSMEEVAEELAKCELVCANCHRTRTRRRLLEG